MYIYVQLLPPLSLWQTPRYISVESTIYRILYICLRNRYLILPRLDQAVLYVECR